MLDKDGYRPNVGIVLCNSLNQVLWARRHGRDGWQFPQGGISTHETPEQAMYRELYEEIGLRPEHVALIGATNDWLYYDIPTHTRRTHRSGRRFRGQKQRWFLLRLLGDDADVCLECGPKPEFDTWMWVEYWHPLQHIIAFKRQVYERALTELEPLLLQADA